jgi:1-acyl-sn-glycerol-3-phosphate acyltransferase
MRWLRACVYYSVLLVLLSVINVHGWLMWAISEPLRLTTRQSRIAHTQRFNRWMTSYISPWVLGLNYRIRGAHRLENTPAVYMMKHQSAWETIASAAFLPLHTWVLKRELLWLPLMGWGLRLVDPVAIIRADPKSAMKALATEGKERLAAGISLVIFPEGTRMPPTKMGEFKAGGAYLAKQCGVRVVPVAHNAGHFWRKNSFIKNPGTITVVIGKSFAVEGKSANEINARVSRWMSRVQAIIEADCSGENRQSSRFSLHRSAK